MSRRARTREQRSDGSIRRAVRDALGNGERFVLAVSGGVDSMVLLDAAAAVVPHRRLIVATFDHGTGLDATRAAALVVERSAVLGIECVAESSTTALESEADLRAARWRFLRGVAFRTGGVVCTAHTADDQVETVLMRILRDAGARGLAALNAESDVLRPLLGFNRADVLRYARRVNLAWIEDPSNASTKYLRNRVRHDVLPALRRVRPEIGTTLLEVADRASRWRTQVESYVARTIVTREAPMGGGLDVDVATLEGYPPSSLAVLWPAIAARAGVMLDRRGTLRLADFTRRARVGARMQLSGAWEVIRSRDALQFRASTETRPTPATLALSHTTSWNEWSFRPAQNTVVDNAWSAWLPTDRRLVIRAWEPGDAMGTRSSGRARKVKRLLSNAGVTGHQRTVWPVVVAEDEGGGEGEIVWVPGVRRSHAASDLAGRSGLSFVCEYVNRGSATSRPNGSTNCLYEGADRGTRARAGA